MPLQFFHTDQGDIAYHQWGQGRRLLLAVHGYGGTSRQFATLASLIGHTFTVCALDLPFHGDTHWKSDTYTPAETAQWMVGIAKQAGFERFSLLGHSFGARVVLAALAHSAARLDTLYLLAPDGIRTRGMGLARLLPVAWRQFCLEHPKTLTLLRWLSRCGVLPRASVQLICRQLSHTPQRVALLHTWNNMQYFTIRKRQILSILQQNTNIQVRLLLGAHDRVIAAAAVRRFTHQMPNTRLHWLNGQHTLNSAEVAAYLLRKP
ncbi:MAG TPA: alpha/beta hydrolase [Saprospiraceae bacterium]|nr:alpha/beta hydrolase [Saprospiraceae bacterium]